MQLSSRVALNGELKSNQPWAHGTRMSMSSVFRQFSDSFPVILWAAFNATRLETSEHPQRVAPVSNYRAVAVSVHM